MHLHMDFEMLLSVAVLNEMATRSTEQESDPAQAIHVTPVTNHHFGGACFYNRQHRRYAWVRAYRENGRTFPDRVVVCFGYNNPPPEWKTGENRNYMKHTHVSHPTETHVQAAEMVIDFILRNVLPDQLFPGDYHYHEAELKG